MTDTLADNIITISFKNQNDKHIEIWHNGVAIYQGKIFLSKTFHIKNCERENSLVIKNIEHSELNHVCMFELGKDKLKNMATYDHNQIVLNYEFPVFPWLHKKLDFGWIIKTIDQ